MKVKISEATPLQLSWMVAVADGEMQADGGQAWIEDGEMYWSGFDGGERHSYSPPHDWELGGPIIERERMTITYNEDDGCWEAYYPDDVASYQRANSPLIAACRCYVASKLGDEAEIPEELV